jgi:hypothetical protein
MVKNCGENFWMGKLSRRKKGRNEGKTKKRREAEEKCKDWNWKTWKNEAFLGTGKEAPNWTWSFIAKISENLGGGKIKL